MEVLLKYGTEEQKRQWLEPLLDGRIRSAFRMTEPDVASSDATNMEATAVARRRRGRRQRAQVVVHRRRQPGLQDARVHGAHRPRRRPALEAHDGARAPRDPRGHRRVRKLTAMAMYDEPLGHAELAFDRRPGARVEHPARTGARLRDRAGPARARPRAPLHASGRAGREGPRAGLPAGHLAGRVRPPAGQARRQRRADRRRPDRHRPGPAAGAARGLEARHRRARAARLPRSARSRSPCR